MSSNNDKLQNFINVGRKKDLEINLFVERCEMVETLVNVDYEDYQIFEFTNSYITFLKLIYDADKVTNFYDKENEVAEGIIQLIDQVEDSKFRKHVIGLALLVLNKIDKAKELIDEKLFTFKVKNDINNFLYYRERLTNTNSLVKNQVRFKNCVDLKQFLKDKYSSDIIEEFEFDFSTINNNDIITDTKDFNVYFCWLQGKNNMPPLINLCYNALQRHIGPYNLIFIDENNMNNYIELSSSIMNKYNEGYITKTHLSDIIRANLLAKYGGLWLDATILITKPLNEIEDFININYFSQKYRNDMIKSDFHIAYNRWAAFLQGTNMKNNPLFIFLKEFFDKYWTENDILAQYFLIDFGIDIAYDCIPFVKQEIDELPINHIYIEKLQPVLNKSINEFNLDELLSKESIHKLSIKHPIYNKENTVFTELCKKYN